MTATPNHALQRTRSAVTLAAANPQTCRQPACPLRASLSLGSLVILGYISGPFFGEDRLWTAGMIRFREKYAPEADAHGLVPGWTTGMAVFSGSAEKRNPV